MITRSLDNVAVFVEDVHVGFAENGVTVVVAQLANRDQGVCRQSWEDMCGLGCCREVWELKFACVGGCYVSAIG